MEWQTLIDYLPQIFQGTLLTLGLIFTSLVAGFCLALLLSLAVISDKFMLKKPAQFYIFVIRGTPLLVQFFLIYYGSGQFTWLQHSFLWVFFKQPFLCAMLTLAINTSAYTSELFVGLS